MDKVDERYKRGMIYTIRNYTDDTLIYVGSTINTLSKRFNKHKEECKNHINRIKLHLLIENNDWSDWYIELYEQYPCNNKKELDRREGQVIREIGTINKNIAGRTTKEYLEENAEKIKERKKKYYDDNADKIKEQKKEYYEQNADKIKEQRKEYYEQNADKLKEKIKEYRKQNTDKIKEQKKVYSEKNADKLKEKMKEYYEQNADKIKEKMAEKVCCNICGAFSNKSNLVRHQKSIKCMAKIPNN